MEKKRRKKLGGEEKVALLKRHLLGREAVSAICEDSGIAPNQFYRWQKEFFENGAAAFQKNGRAENARVRKLEDEVVRLQERIARKEKVIAEIAEDNVKLKKNLGEA